MKLSRYVVVPFLFLVSSCAGQKATTESGMPRAPGPAAVGGEVDSLKLFRSYYHIQLESPNAHQFEVWYTVTTGPDAGTWEHFQAALQEKDDASILRPDQYLSSHQVFVGYPEPPQTFTPVPARLKSLEEGLNLAVARNHAGSKPQDVRISYLGKAARVMAYEIVPLVRGSNAGKNVAISSARFFLADLAAQQLGKPLGSSCSGFSSLKVVNENHEPMTQAHWVDYVQDGPRAAAAGLLYLDVENDKKISLPGRAIFTSFDVHPETPASSARLTGPSD